MVELSGLIRKRCVTTGNDPTTNESRLILKLLVSIFLFNWKFSLLVLYLFIWKIPINPFHPNKSHYYLIKVCAKVNKYNDKILYVKI